MTKTKPKFKFSYKANHREEAKINPNIENIQKRFTCEISAQMHHDWKTLAIKQRKTMKELLEEMLNNKLYGKN